MAPPLAAIEGYSGVRFDDAGAPARRPAPTARQSVEILGSPTRTEEGYLRAQGILTRAGVLEYHDAITGQLRRELRPPEEVFDPESIRSFALLPITVEHPDQLLDSNSARGHSVGAVGTPERVDNLLRADVLIHDASAIREAEQGRNHLSCGYRQVLEERPGLYLDPATGREERFDAVQTKIRGNHVALTDDPRAAEARIRMDSAGRRAGARKDSKMRIKMNGTECDVPDALIKLLTPEQLQSLGIEIVNADAFKPEEKEKAEPPAADPAPKMDGDKVDLDTEADKSDDEKRMDAKGLRRALAEERGKSAGLRAALAIAKTISPEQAKAKQEEADKARMDAMGKQIEERVRLTLRVAPIIGKRGDNDKEGKTVEEIARMDSRSIHAAVLAREAPSTKIEGESPEFLRGCFEALMSNRTDTVAELGRALDTGREISARMDASDKDDGIESARAAMLDRSLNAWKTAAK